MSDEDLTFSTDETQDDWAELCSNPVGTELLSRARERMGSPTADDRAEKYEDFGGEEVFANVVHRVRVATGMEDPIVTQIVGQYPALIVTLDAAIMLGFWVGVAACERKREIDEQMRAIGVE